MGLSEKQIEDVFQVFYKRLISKDLQLIGRQKSVQGLRVDLLFKDVSGKNVVLELKKDAVTRADIGQVMEYAGLVQNSRVILAAPIIVATIKQAFDHYGIEYLEFNAEKIEELWDRIKREKPPENLEDVRIPTSVVREPLGRRKPDGNIAFKVTYVDSGWNGVCSDKLYQYNIVHRVWCKEQDPECRAPEYRNPTLLDLENYPCLDSIAMKTLHFQSGYFHNGPREWQPIRCLQAMRGKLVFLPHVNLAQKKMSALFLRYLRSIAFQEEMRKRQKPFSATRRRLSDLNRRHVRDSGIHTRTQETRGQRCGDRAYLGI
jgi:hypothetical protein